MEHSVDSVTLENFSDIYKIIISNTLFEPLLFRDYAWDLRSFLNILLILIAIMLPFGFNIWHILILQKNFAVAMFQVTVMTHGICLIVRIVTVLVYREEIVALISVNFREFNSNKKRPNFSLNMLKGSYVTMQKLDKFMKGNFLLLLGSWYILPAFISKAFVGLLVGRNGIGEVLRGLPTTFPVEETSVSMHMVSWTYHIVFALVVMSIWITLNFLCFGVTILMKKQYQILRNSLLPDHGITADCKEPLKLREFVQDHVKLIRMTNIHRNIISPIVGAQMMQTIFITAVATYVAAKPTSDPGNHSTLNFVAYSFLSLLELLAFCWQSHIANQANESLGFVIYHFSLNDPLAKGNKDWHLPLMMSQKTIKYKALGLVEINMETFLGVLRTSYSYYTLMQAKT